MKIAIFTNNYFPRISGVSVAVDFADRALQMQGHETRIIAPDYGESGEIMMPLFGASEWDRAADVPVRESVFGERGSGPEQYEPLVHRVPALTFRKHKVALSLSGFELSRILGIIEGFQPDIIHSNHPFLLGDSAHKAADTFSIPLVYTYHTLYEFFSHYVGLDIEIVRQVIRDFVTQYANNCDLVIAPTDPIQEYLHKTGVTSDVVSIPTGVDISRFTQFSRDDVKDFAFKHGLHTFSVVLLYTGRIAEEKNAADAWEATRLLVDQGVNCCLFMCGKGPLKKTIQDRAGSAGMKNRIIFGGFLGQEELPKAYLASDVFLFPSKSDTQGIVLYEAQAAALPIVAYNSMAARACVKDGVNGFLVDPELSEFTQAVKRVIDDPESFKPEDISPKYSLEAIGQAYTSLYEDLAQKGRRISSDRYNFIRRSRKRMNVLEKKHKRHKKT